MPARVPSRPIARSPSTKGFLDLRSFQILLGDLRNGRIGSLPISLLYFQLLYFLRDAEKNFAPDVGSIPRRLLEHNFSPTRNRSVCEMLEIDADIDFRFDATDQATDIQFKAYFDHPGLERPAGQRRVVLHVSVLEADGLRRTVSVPLQALMAGWGDVAKGSQGYSHSITFLERERAIEQWFYVGITTRNWLVRMDEHFQEVRSGSNKTFHAAWRSYAGKAEVVLCSELVVLNHTYEGIMDWEEEQVDLHLAAGTSLNMIPGGFKGLRLLHQHRITPGIDISLEERDAAVADYVKARGIASRVPNFFLSKLWLDDGFYLKVLAGRNDVLTPAQVVEIRKLAVAGNSAEQIVGIVDARNVNQVRRLLAGKTYTRIT